MATRITDRFSKITRLSGSLNAEDLMVVSQKEGTVQKTANATVGEVYTYIENQIKTNGIDSIINIGNGIIGSGTSTDPVRLDPILLDQTYARKDHFTITRVGNRKTRYLPISRTSLFVTSTFNSKTNRPPYCSTIETSGELRIIQPADNAYTLSIGDWGTSGNVDSLQIIERKLQPNNLPEGYRVKGVLSKSKNSAILILGMLEAPTQEEFWYASLTDGSLAEESFFDFVKITSRSTALGGVMSNNSVACARTAAGGRMFFVAVPPTEPNSGISIRGYTLGTGTTGTVTELSTWNVSSYCGLFTSQTQMRVSDKFLGTTAEKCELVDKTGGMEVGLLNSGKSTTRLQCINNPDAENDLYMIVRREHNLSHNGEKTVYVADLTFKITVNASTGVCSAVAIAKYLNNKPTVDAGWVYTNKRNTFRTESLGVTDSEVMFVLGDGSVMLIGDTANGTEEGKIYALKSDDGFGPMDMLDVDAAVTAKRHSKPMVIDPKPGYGTSTALYKVYVASPINVYMNGTNYTLPAQIIDLTTEVNSATPTVFDDMPYGGGEFAGLSFRIVYLYLQQAGKIIQLVKTNQMIPESITNTLLAVVYFTNAGTARALYGQAYSRMAKYRPSYVPMGAAVPVSYNNPAEKPVTYWLQQALSGDGTPTFWTDAAATISQVQYASDGRTVYIRSIMSSSMVGRAVRMNFNEIDLGVKTYSGSALIWQATVSNKTDNHKQVPAILTETITGEEVARSYLTVTPYPFSTDVVGTMSGDDVVTSVIQGVSCYVRVQGYDLLVGDTISVSVINPSGVVTNLGQQTYQGFPLYYPYPTTVNGVHQVKTTNVTRNLTPPNITFTVSPAILYYTPGEYTLAIEPGQHIKATMVAGGGGGGGSIHNYSSSNYWVSNLGGDGGDTSLKIYSNEAMIGLPRSSIVTSGGKGGVGGNWGNGSSFTNGSAGRGGRGDDTFNTSTYEPRLFAVLRNVAGNQPLIVSRFQRQPGGDTVDPELPTTNNGAGGQGAWGCGDGGWSYGGGGGSGGYGVVQYHNLTTERRYVKIVVGAGGVGWKKTAVTNGNNGDDGTPGYMIIEFL